MPRSHDAVPAKLSQPRHRSGILMDTGTQHSTDCEFQEKKNATTRLHRKASAMTSFFGKCAADPEFQKSFSPCYIFSQMYFEKPIDLAEARRVLWERLGHLARFRCNVVCHKNNDKGEKLLPLNSIFWEEHSQEELDMAYHVVELKDVDSEQDVINLLNRVYSGDFLSVEHPLWRFYVINNMKDGRSLLLGIIDHTVADGMSLFECLMSSLDDPPDAPEVRVRKRAAPPSLPLDVKAQFFLAGLSRFVLGIVNPKFVADPKSKLSIPPQLRGAKPPPLHALASSPIDLARLKEVKEHFPGATINDILCGLMNMCIRRFLEDVGDPIVGQGKTISAGFPVSFHKPDENLEETMGNRIAMGRFSFNFSYHDRIECVWRCKQGIDYFKHSPELPLTRWALDTVFSSFTEQQIDEIFTQSPAWSALISNVAGPQTPVHFMGQMIQSLNFYAFAANHGLYIGVFSYAGKVTATFCAHPDLMSDASDVGKYWSSEFEALREEVLAKKGSLVPLPYPGRAKFILKSLLALAGTSVAVHFAWRSLFKLSTFINLLPWRSLLKLSTFTNLLSWSKNVYLGFGR